MTTTETYTETYTEIATEITTAMDTCTEANSGTATAADGTLDTAEYWLTQGTEITTTVVADRLGLSGTHVSRMLETGELPGRKVAKGGVSIWLVPEAAVQREFDTRERVRLSGLAAELGVSYHQLYGLVSGLGLSSRRGMREAILLSADEIQRVRDEVERQAVARSAAMTHSEAAQHLGVPDPLIQTLVRSRVLAAVKSGSRTARVTRGSVEDYAARFPARGIRADEKVVAFADVRDVLRVSRNAVSDLICTRRLTVIGIDRVWRVTDSDW